MSSSSHSDACAVEKIASRAEANTTHLRIPEEETCVQNDRRFAGRHFGLEFIPGLKGDTETEQEWFLRKATELFRANNRQAELRGDPSNWSVGKRLAPLAGVITGIKDSSGDFDVSLALQNLGRHAVDINLVIQDLKLSGEVVSYRQEHNLDPVWEASLAHFRSLARFCKLFEEREQTATMVKAYAEWRQDELLNYNTEILQSLDGHDTAQARIGNELAQIVNEMPQIQEDWAEICRQKVPSECLPTPKAYWSYMADICHNMRMDCFPILQGVLGPQCN